MDDYNNDNPVTTASEPAVAYQSTTPTNAWQSNDKSVEEYFDKAKENLDKRFDAQSFDELLDQLEAQSTTPPPCQYTVEEAVQRVIRATADVDAGRGLMAHEEFEKLVRSWY